MNQVAVVGADGQGQLAKTVKLGPATGSDFIVERGPRRPASAIVVEGLQKIRDGMVVKPVSRSRAIGRRQPHRRV